MEHEYICIDLKSYYASVECVERGLDPLKAMLVVADPDRGRGTICLAVSPAMKAAGVRNRCRVFEIPDGMEYVMATPRMQRYLDVSGEIYATYLEFVSPEDIHVYSIDECFIDVTPYLSLYRVSAPVLARRMMDAVLERTGIPSTCGIGPNLFLAKLALDVLAKHEPDGIAILDEDSFKERLWHHRPITDVWGIARGKAARLEKHRLFDLYDVAHADPALLRAEFGVDADLLIDHAWGIEPCTIAQIRAYVPKGESIASNQVLMRDYDSDEAAVVLKEMAEEAVIELARRNCVAGRISVAVRYAYKCTEATSARTVRKLNKYTDSRSDIVPRALELFHEIVDENLPIKQIGVGLADLLPSDMATVDLFTDQEKMEREHDLTDVIMKVRDRFGNDAVMRGVSLRECATGYERAHQIGGHRA